MGELDLLILAKKAGHAIYSCLAVTPTWEHKTAMAAVPLYEKELAKNIHNKNADVKQFTRRAITYMIVRAYVIMRVNKYSFHANAIQEIRYSRVK